MSVIGQGVGLGILLTAVLVIISVAYYLFLQEFLDRYQKGRRFNHWLKRLLTPNVVRDYQQNLKEEAAEKLRLEAESEEVPSPSPKQPEKVDTEVIDAKTEVPEKELIEEQLKEVVEDKVVTPEELKEPLKIPKKISFMIKVIKIMTLPFTLLEKIFKKKVEK